MNQIKTYIILIFLFCFSASIHAQITLLTDTINTSLRGLSVVNDSIVWVCGSKGTVGKSTDGTHFKFWKISTYEKSEFRDIEAFDSLTAYIMSTTKPSLILKTVDGGNTWKEMFKSNDTNIFLDALAFQDSKNGFAVGDPINGNIILYQLKKGKKWKKKKYDFLYVKTNESLFAASGTCMQIFDNNELAIVTGGSCSRLIRYNIKEKTSQVTILDSQFIRQGNSGSGAFSICKTNLGYYIIVGGNYIEENSNYRNSLITKDDGQRALQIPPYGYRECIINLKRGMICCGPTGVDFSLDGGLSWKQYSNLGFHTIQQSKNGHVIYLVGNKGSIGKITSLY